MSPEEVQAHAASLEGNYPDGATFKRSKELLLQHNATELVIELRNLNSKLDKASASSDALGKKLFWLNLALVAATTVGAVATGLHAFKAFFGS
jgi:hypothetical protein